MKKIRNLCIAIIALVGLSSSAFADGTTPKAGATHSYYVNSSDAGATYGGIDKHTYRWYVTKNDLTTVETSDLTLVSGTTAVYVDDETPVQNLYKVDLTWKSASVGNTYFVHTIETNLEGCQNHKVMKVIPLNDFQIAFRNVSRHTDNSVINAIDNFKTCAPDVALSLNVSNDVVYSYGDNTLIYKLSASNISNDVTWTVNYNIIEDTDNTVSATYGYLSGNAISNEGSLDISGSAASFNVGAGNTDVYVVVNITNDHATQGEGLTEKDYIFNLVSGADGTDAANAAKIIDAVDASVVSGGNLAKTQSVKARPDTNGIHTN